MSQAPDVRHDASAYDRYLAGMDASMRQKVALTAAHLLAAGSLADMGMGSGSGSHALAALYPDLDVVGVDLDPIMVAKAAKKYALPNLRFQVGDIAAPCFPERSLDAILDSSVLHHVTSFNGYDRHAAARALDVQARALVDHGVLVVRDFLDPGPGLVWLDVRADDGDESDDPRTCSTAALTRRFAREFRSLRPEAERGFPLREIVPAPGDPPLAAGFARFELEYVHAVELALRKDYRHSWEDEVREEYTYLTQPELEAVFAGLGLRVLASTPLRNPWILQHRFAGQLSLWDATTRAPLDWPATNYVIVGQRVPDGGGVRFDAQPLPRPLGYLALACWERRADRHVFDLARRPGLAVDVVPWFERGGAVHVLARRSYPRPLLGLVGRAIDGTTPPSWVSAPLNVLVTDVPLGEAVADQLTTLEGLSEADLLAFEPGTRYLPSPGGVEEEVRSVFVRVRQLDATAEPRRRGLSDAGHVRAIEASQLLRAAQVGGLPDARLELNVYDLLLRQDRPVGAWIGAEVAVPDAPPPPRRETLADLAARPPRRAFVRAGRERSPGFLCVEAHEFTERDRHGRSVGEVALDVVIPARHRAETVAVAVLRRFEGEVWLGVDDDDLPAAQCFDGRSDLLVTPAWRLPRGKVATLRELSRFVRRRLRAEYGVVVAGREVPLGGSYHPSPGVTPEVVHPVAVAVADEAAGGVRALTWVRLADAVERRDLLVDGHLRVVALRAAHALGLIG
ncbi:MAG: class I SAM-dependent methyltransferase [Myxococcales bacterium]|nr:class I SAM-dependent methyltransferase [Myxococcales bacterium]